MPGSLQHENQPLEQVLQAPPTWWRAHALRTPGTRSEWFVRRLLERAAELSSTNPAAAIDATALATELSAELPDAIRGEAWREHAYALLFVGRFPEAEEAVDRAQGLLASGGGIALARTWLTRALVYRSTDRVAEAITLTRDAAAVFHDLGETDRWLKARMTEAAMLHQQGSIAAALEIWMSLEEEPLLRDGATYGMLLQNIGTSYSQLGELDRANDYLTRAMDEHAKRGAEVDRVRTRWSIGSALAAGGRLDEALPLLRQTRREFDALEMRSCSALVGLEIVELLLAIGQGAEVAAICRAILDDFTRSGMTSRAITALSFLREAVAIGKATPTLVRHVHDFLRADSRENSPRIATFPAL